MTVNGRGMVSGSGENVAMAIVELDDWDKRTTEELSLSSIVRRIQEGQNRYPRQISWHSLRPPFGTSPAARKWFKIFLTETEI